MIEMIRLKWARQFVCSYVTLRLQTLIQTKWDNSIHSRDRDCDRALAQLVSAAAEASGHDDCDAAVCGVGSEERV
jgi:hypothetical protein